MLERVFVDLISDAQNESLPLSQIWSKYEKLLKNIKEGIKEEKRREIWGDLDDRLIDFINNKWWF